MGQENPAENKPNLSAKPSTLGPAYNEFSDYEHSATMSKFFLGKEQFWLALVLKSLVTTSIADNKNIFMN